MNIESLKMFCLVIDIGSISQAAKLSYVSQPAVTKQIRQLENSYGTTLFNRKEGRLFLNENGKILYPFAKTIVEDYKRSKEAVLDNVNKLDSQLKVGASFTIGEYLLPNILGAFKRDHPETKITLIVENTPSVLEAISNDVIDVALVEGMIENKDFDVLKFETDQLILIYSSEHPWKDKKEVDIEQLANEKMLWREPTSGTRLIIENLLREQGVLDKIENYMELGSTQAIKAAVEAGLGISIVSKLAVERELSLGLIHEMKIKNSSFKRDLWLVRKKNRFNKKSIHDFVHLVNRQQ